MKVCIAGKNAIAVHGLQSTVNLLGADSVVVCPNSTDRGISDWQPSLMRYAKEFGVEVINLRDIYDIEDLIFISLQFDKIVRPEKFKTKHLFNIHFSKLPAYKGVYTAVWPILNGEMESGVTLHRIDHGIDTGEIIDQSAFLLAKTETARSLYFKCLNEAARLLDKNLTSLIDKSCDSAPQKSENSTYYSKNSIDYSNLAIDIKQTATGIDRQVRAYSFRENQIPIIGGISVGRYEITETRSKLKPGSIRNYNSKAFVLSTIDFDIVFYRDQYNELFSSVEENDCTKVNKYLKEGCDPNITNSKGWSPLMIAAYNGNIQLCDALLKAGADLNMTNQNGTSPLMYAKEACSESGQFNLCAFLIDSGADPNIKDNFGHSVYDYSVKGGQTKAIEFLKKCL